MVLAVSERTDSYIQFLTVLILFVFVLLITYLITKWMAGYQRGQTVNTNMEMVETIRLSNNKYVQILRVGKKYLAVAICKDTVTMLAEIPEEDIIFSGDRISKTVGFRDVLEKIQKKNFLEKEDGRDE